MATYRSDTYRSDYHRDEDRDKQGGWKSWFGLGDNKDEDRDRGYNYSKTTTYRDGQPSYGYSSSDRYPERTTGTGYSGNISGGYTTGARGGYGYTTSDEANRGQLWNQDRDYTTRTGYGMSGDRDVSYRTYGGDRESYPIRSYGFSGEQHMGTRGGYPGYSSDQCRHIGDYSSRYPTVGDRDYTTSTTSRYQTGDRDFSSRYPVTGGTYGDSQRLGTYGGDYGRTYGGDYTSRHGYSGDRDIGRYSGESRVNTGYGFGGDREYNRSYQQSTRY